MRRDTPRGVWVGSAVAWLFGVVAAYYVVHKPVAPGIALHQARLLGQLVFSVLFLLLAGGLGRRLTAFMTQNDSCAPFLHAAFGFGIAGIAMLLIGVTIGVNTWVAWGFLLLTGWLTWRDCVSWARHALASLSGLRPTGAFGWLVLGMLGCLLALGMTTALTAPLRFDALVYHLALPKSYLLDGRVAAQIENLYSSMPQAGEMLYLLAMAGAGEEAAALVGWMCAVVTLWGLAIFIHHYFGRAAAWAGLAAVMAGASLSLATAWAYVDWIAMLFSLGLLVCLVIWRRSQDPRMLALAGAFAGFALGTKYSAGFLVIGALAVVLWVNRAGGHMDGFENERASHTTSILRRVTLFSIPALACVAPWWLKNLAYTGNPFSPFFFVGEGMNAFRVAWFQGSAGAVAPGAALLAPITATLLGGEGMPGFGASIGPLLLGLAPLAWLGYRKRSILQRGVLSTCVIFSLAGLGVWMAASLVSSMLSQTRLFLPLAPALACLAGVGLVSLDNHAWTAVRPGRLGRAAILLVLALTLLEVSVDSLTREAPQAMIGALDQESYQLKNLGWYLPAMQALSELPPGARVRLLWEPRSYHCMPVCDPDELLDAWVLARRGEGRVRNPAEILAGWREQGYTHLMVYAFGVEHFRGTDARYTPQDWADLKALLGSLPAPVDYDGVYQLYDLRP